MRVAVISDLHLGTRADRALFGHEPEAFAAWLAEIAADHDHLVLGGDIYQTDHVWPSWSRRLREYHDARAATPVLARRFGDARVHYIHGNHDEVAARTGVPDRVRFEHDGVALFVTHGHQFDPVAKHTPMLAECGALVTGALRRTGFVRVSQALEARDIAIKHARFGGPTGVYARGAVDLARRERAQVVVLGHTHCAELHLVDDVVYANSGTCSNRRRELVSIDLAAGWVAIGRPEIVQRIPIPGFQRS